MYAVTPARKTVDSAWWGIGCFTDAEVMATIRQLKEHGLSILLVEQNARLVFDVADDIVILNSGRVVVDATAEALKRDGVDLHQHLGIY